MAKRTFYTQSALVNYDIEDLRTIVKRESERINKQITRAQRRGVAFGEIYVLNEKGEIDRPTRAVEGMTQGELLKLYARMQEGEYTIKAVQERYTEREEIAKEIGLATPSELKPEDLNEFLKARRRSNSESALFYQTLVKAVESGIAEDTQFFLTDERYADMTSTPAGRQKFIKQMLKKINQAIEKSNKQRDELGLEKREDLISLVSMRADALKYERGKAKERIERRNYRRSRKK